MFAMNQLVSPDQASLRKRSGQLHRANFAPQTPGNLVQSSEDRGITAFGIRTATEGFDRRIGK